MVAQLDGTRWTGRPGYPIRAMVGMALVKSLYAIPTWSRTAALVAEHAGLQAILGCVPSVYACYRFTAKLIAFRPLLDSCIERVVGSLSDADPDLGRDVSIDASDMPAYANGQRFVSKGGRERSDDEFSDPDASWGHRSAVSTRKGGGFYGYKLQLAVCSRSGLPLAWQVETARSNESQFAVPLIDRLRERGLAVETCALDKSYDNGPIYDACEERGCRPIIPLRQTIAVARGDAEPPRCQHGEWRFAGSDSKRGASKWRCPTAECKPASRWIKANRLHPLIPRDTLRWRKLYKGRASVEREFGRLKHEWALLPLRVRGLERVQLHADLTILAKLSCSLARGRAAPMAA
ncbi:MAG: transposase [Thermoleophilaceae bacterium]|nr:transposase [Thermoleophilaceae bacterium]